MKDSDSSANTQYDINCQTHQQFARHSEWKYFEQFNELKRKIQKFVNNTIVIKNPVPDELIKTAEMKNQKNMFINKQNNEKIIFPRIGAFEIYMYNILISSKLMTTQWPNHYKILQIVGKMIQQKKKGNSLDNFSVYSQTVPETNIEQNKQANPNNISPQRKNVRIVSKKKKIVGVNTALSGKAYKSIEKGTQTLRDPKATIDLISQKFIDKEQLVPARNKKVHRYLQSKADKRVKLPSLSNTMANFRQQKTSNNPAQRKQEPKEKPIVKKPVNPIEQFQRQDLSVISLKQSDLHQSRKFSFLQLKPDQIKNNNNVNEQQQQQDLKFMQNQSVQYSQPDGKDLMNRSIQYEEEEGFYCDFGMQIDERQMRIQKESSYQWVQTEKIQLVSQAKPYTFDQQVEANIIITVPCDAKYSQTQVKQFIDQSLGTDVVLTINRQIQFPEEVARSLDANQLIDVNFHHLYEKRRNIIDHEEYYSVDRFQQKSSKYKWIGRANLADSTDELKKKIFIQCLVFSVYNYYGIKTPQKRLSYQQCSNVIGQKLKEGLMHILTFDNPQIQYLHMFQDFNYTEKRLPLSEIITFKSSKQPIKFNNYGGFLALAYLLNDYDIFNQQNNQLGFVIVNQAVKQIHKLSALNYQIHSQVKTSDQDIIVNSNDNITIKIQRLSECVQLQFFSMLARICDNSSFEELIKYIRQIFIHSASTYQQFKMTILSLRLQQSQEQTVEDFIQVLEHRVNKIRQSFKGKLYTYKKYHSLTPNIKYSRPSGHKIQRKLNFKDKTVTVHDILKHLRNNNTMVLVQGEQGSGKTSLLNQMVVQLKNVQKINVMVFSWMKRQSQKIKDELFQLSKNILLIDNAEEFDAQVFELIQQLKIAKYEVSYCILTTSSQQVQIFKNRFNNLNIVQTKLLPLSVDQIREYLMKVLKFKSYTDKKDIIQTLVAKPSYVRILQLPFYLSIFSSNLQFIDGSTYKIKDKDLTKYMILKEHFSICTTNHNEQMKEMSIQIKNALPNLRRIAFEYYHNRLQINQTIKQVVSLYQQNQLIRSQLVYYPINLESIVSASYQNLFSHQLFLKYFLIQAYSYFVQKSYRNMRMNRLYSDKFLLDLITERYKWQQSHNQLLQVVASTKKFKTASEASSNAITLLSKMGYVFSNMNFDDCIFPQADLSNSIFYQCSFRGADLQQVIMYKSQMISCIFDSAIMNRINLFSRKYEIQFTAVTCSISADGRRIAFGCGNYLIVVNSDTGVEIKRIEAHLDIIRMVRFTRDGNSLVTIADDKTLRIWDVYTYKSVVFKLPQKGSISYSNQTETIASVNKNSLKVWNLKSMANEAQLQGHTEPITLVQFSYDGQLILTGSKDTTLRLWTRQGKQKVTYKGHDDEIVAGKLSPVKRTMVSSSKGKDLILWQVQSGSKLLTKKFMSEVHQICLDNKEKYILVTFANDNHIIVLDFLNMDIVHALSGHEAKVVSLNFDNNFQQLISLGKDRTARVWQFEKIMDNEVRSPKIFKKIHKGPVLAIAYNKLNSTYVTSHENGQINIWNFEDNALVDQVVSHNGPVKCLKIDRAGKIYSGGSDGTLRIWSLEVKRQPKIVQIHSSQMLQMKLSQKNRFIATSSVANELVINDFTGIKIVMSTRQEGRVSAIEFSLDQKILAVGGAQKYVALYQIANSNSVNRSVQLGQHSEAITSMCFYGDSMLVVALKNGQVAIWNYHKASLMKKIENVSPIRSILQFQKKYICLTSQDGKIRIVNMDEGKQIKIFKYSEAPTAIDTNDDQSVLIAGTTSGNLIKWNLNCVKPPSKKVEFDRKAIDSDCSRMITVEGGKTLLLKDLFYHKEEILQVKVDSDIEGVTFDDDKIIMLLKNGKCWQYGKREYKFNNSNYYEGDMHSIRDKNITNFYRSGIKKIKGMNKPSLAIIEQVNNQ